MDLVRRRSPDRRRQPTTGATERNVARPSLAALQAAILPGPRQRSLDTTKRPPACAWRVETRCSHAGGRHNLRRCQPGGNPVEDVAVAAVPPAAYVEALQFAAWFRSTKNEVPGCVLPCTATD